MVEFLNEADIEAVASTELKDYRATAEALKASTEWVSQDFDKTTPIDNARFVGVLDAVEDSIAEAQRVVDKAVSNGLPEGHINNFSRYVRKKTADAVSLIRKHKAITEVGGHPVLIDSLRIPIYAEEKLRLYTELSRDKRAGSADFSSRREHFRLLKILPLAQLSPETKTTLDAFSAGYTDLSDTKPPHVELAELQTVRAGVAVDEVDALELLLTDKFPGTDVSWIKGNPNVLVKLLELTQSFEGNSVKKIGNLDGLRQLKAALEKVKEITLSLEEKAKFVPGTDIDDELNKFNLSGNRATGDHFKRIDELLEVINTILEVENTPQFAVWRDSVAKNILLYGVVANGETYDEFLKRVDKKVRSQTQLDDAEVKDLQRILEHLDAQEDIITRINYPEDSGADFNKKLHELQRNFIRQEEQKVSDLLQQDSERGTGPSRLDKDSIKGQIAEGKLRIVQGIYERLQELNDQLPPFEDLRPIENPGSPEAHKKFRAFMQELILALSTHFMDVFNRTASSGGTKRQLPSESISLWGKEKFKAAQGIEGDDTLDVFMRDFPWDQLMPGISADEKKSWIDLWKLRIVHIEQMHNYAYGFRTEIEVRAHKPDEVENVLKLISGKVNDGGLFRPDMDAFYSRHREDDGSLINKYIGPEEDYWRVPEMVNFFIHWIEREVPDYSTGNPPTEDALNAAKSRIISRIPKEYRIFDAKGKPRDAEIVEMAWLVAFWTLYPTFRIFDMDDGALAFKTSRLVNTGEVGTKYTFGRTNTADRWADSGVQHLNRIWPPRSLFIHAYAEMPAHVYETYSLQQLEDELRDLQAKIKNPAAHGLDKADVPGLVLRERELEKFIIETKQLGTGEYQKISGVDDILEIEQKIAEIEKAIDDLVKAKEPVGDFEKLQLANFKELARELRRAERLSKAAGDSKDVINAKVRSAAVRYGVAQRYVLLRIKPEYTALKPQDPTSPTLDVREMAPIRVPTAYFDHASAMANRPKAVPGRENLIALSDDQIIRSRIDPALVRYDTLTPAHGTRWAAAAQDMLVWNDMLDGTKKDGVFTPIHDAHLDSKINRKSKYSRVAENVRMFGERLRARFTSDPRQIAQELDEYLRGEVVITQLERDDFAVNMKFDRITKTGMRYAGPKLMACGPQLEGEEQMITGELWSEMFRRLYRKEHDGHVETFTDLRKHSPEANALNKKKKTPTPPGIRLSSDLLNMVNAEGKPIFKNAAQNQMVVEAFMMAVAMYLDRYRYKSIEEGHGGLEFFGDQLEATKSQIHTVTPGVEPMDFAHRELFIQLCEAAFESFLGPDFGGEDFDENLDKKIVRVYTRKAVEDMMRDFGIIGSTEQYVVDMVYFKNDFAKHKEVADAKKSEGKH